MWCLELFGNLTDINVIDTSGEISILSDLETYLPEEFPEEFPYGCYDVEILDATKDKVEINIIHESNFSNHMEKTSAIIRKL